MNYLINVFFGSITSLFLIGFTSAQESPVPPNMAQISTQLFVDPTEIANIHWQEYLSSVKKDSSATFYASQKPDPFVNNHEGGPLYLHPAHRFKPIVGVSFAQVQNFCQWRSRIVTEQYNQEHHEQAGKYEFVYRLPEESEWEQAAQGGLEMSLYPYGLLNLEKIDPKKPVRMHPPAPLINYKNDRHKLFKLEKIFAFDNPNGYGLYNMIGNVAEMIQEEGVAKGGSWMHRLQECKIRMKQYYTTPANWLGFRCVCEVKPVE